MEETTMSPEQKEDLKRIWAYMVAEGELTTGEFSYYSGFEGKYKYNITEMDKVRKAIIKDLNKHGVAWDASGVPDYVAYSQFVGTDSPSEQCECLIGILVLKNGQTFRLGVSDASDEYIDLVASFDRNTPKTDYVSHVFKDYNHID
jgi:hypothetical protein